ncbi:Uma2 family endonuclease [Cryptosporangium aurantiacum]|uniref:Endonuclease, Uma2 family (Restriction endonuclease fold) n=1 Tax=Cryptosporangium aurantiacum TaxID=134849 RepID=A0A1M7R788_9ACTN|nr:Uma2 family endonuclease [Cryptosporangium aurantiacum]SHN42177.1 Endonuclease, Uma2 family (restriction endonuclease fold) [Cryptosporangium aurantiacum]
MAAVTSSYDSHLEEEEEAIGWTEDELEMVPEKVRYEIEDGILSVSPRPALWHQRFLLIVATMLDSQCPEEWTPVPEAEIRVYENDKITQSRSPDLMVVPTKLTTTEADRGWVYPQEIALALEIVSRSSRITDRMTKAALYAEWKIPLYLRVESKPRLALYEYRLDTTTGQYRTPMEYLDVFETDDPFPIPLELSQLA